jgi:hypothetical protein
MQKKHKFNFFLFIDDSSSAEIAMQSQISKILLHQGFYSKAIYVFFNSVKNLKNMQSHPQKYFLHTKIVKNRKNLF